MNPYQRLGVAADADDRTIRQAYLAAVKLCSPESDPLGFQQISSAYESIKDEESRLGAILNPPQPQASSPAEVLVAHARQAEPLPLDMETMKAFLRGLA